MTGNTLGAGTSLYGNIRIVALPPDLRTLDQARILEGKILNVQKDGLIMIGTEHGNVTIKTDTPAHLQNKIDIELRLEAGFPPTRAILRPAAREAEEARTDKTPVQTTLTADNRLAKKSQINAQHLLSGAPLQMVLLGSGEVVAQPFMEQIRSRAFFPHITNITNINGNISGQRNDLMPPVSGDAITANTAPDLAKSAGFPYMHELYASSLAQFSFDKTGGFSEIIPPKAQAEATTLLAQNTLNAVSLPFRAIAVQVIGTSSETRISSQKASFAPTDTASPNAQSSINKTDNYANIYQAELRVASISAPQVNFANSSQNGNGGKLYGINNPHLLSASNGQGVNNDLLFGTVLSSRIGYKNAVVEGFTQTRGLPVLRMLTPDSLSGRLYAVETPIRDLPMGSQMEFEVRLLTEGKEKGLESFSLAERSTPMVSASQLLTPGNWPIMEEVQQSLSQASPLTVQAFNASLPSASMPAQLGAGILFFVAAMRSGDVQSWLGDKAVEVLKRSGKGSLPARLGGELSSLAKMSKENISGEWRALSIPLVWQDEVHKMVIYTNHESADFNDENDKNGKGRKTRFIVDISLSNIGQVQLDGLFSGDASDTQESTSGRLDLVLRTRQGFSQAMKQQMRSAYKSALDETRITGELSFQDHTLDWVRITPREATEYSTDA